jgi:hypothetical protein
MITSKATMITSWRELRETICSLASETMKKIVASDWSVEKQ